MARDMRVLGIETSCDETGAAIVSDRAAPGGIVLAERLHSQIVEHRPFGGVVPEIAARAHLEKIDGVVAGVLAEAGLELRELDGIAATAGPGLVGGVMVGMTLAKALALASRRPFIAVNHLEAHALSVRLVEAVPFPYLLLLISGGHCQLLAVAGVGRYRRLGTTIDDAVGEAFDKCAKLLDLGYPGGPAIERAAAVGDPAGFALPRPMLGRPGCDFSFSGLKTAVRLAAARLAREDRQGRCDLAAGFQASVVATLVDRTGNGLAAFQRHHPGPARLVVAGGVAANRAIRTGLEALAGKSDARLIVPPPALCTDNGAMVAWAGLERLRLGLIDGLDTPARPRWPLDPSAEPAAFAGVKA